MKTVINPEQHRDVSQLIAASIAALLVGVLNLSLPDVFTVGPNWLLLVLVAVLLVPVYVTILQREALFTHNVLRVFTFILLGVLTLALIVSLAQLVLLLHELSAKQILLPAAIIWPCNVLIWSIWYWEIDGNGPRLRRKNGHEAVDFQFPQQNGGNRSGWVPGFIDYLFLAFCFATALSPADTVPLTRRAKLMMMGEALISMLVLVLLVSRSVNII